MIHFLKNRMHIILHTTMGFDYVHVSTVSKYTNYYREQTNMSASTVMHAAYLTKHYSVT